MSKRILRLITRLNVGGPSIQAIDLSCDVNHWDTRLLSGHLAEGEADMKPYCGNRAVNHGFVDNLVQPISPLNDMKALGQIIREIKQFKPDLIHTHHAKAGMIGRLAASLTGVPVIHTFHGNVFRGHFGPAKTRFIIEIEKRLAPLANKLIAISERQRLDLTATFKITEWDRIRVIPLGFHLNRFLNCPLKQQDSRQKLGLPQSVPLLGIVGRLTEVKNHDFFLRGLSRLKAEWHGAIIGDGHLEHELRQMAQQRGVDNRLHFLPTQNPIEEVYRALDILAVTSHSEGTPVTLIEAMATGLPAVASAVGGIPDLAGDDRANLYKPNDLASFESAVDDLHPHNTERRSHLAQRAKDHVKNVHGFDSLVSSLDALYNEVLS